MPEQRGARTIGGRPAAARGRERADATSALTLELARDEHAPAEARIAAQAWCGPLDVDEEAEQLLLIILSELVANAVEHSSAARELPIAVEASLSEHAMHVSVADRGHGFEPSPRRPVGHQRGYGLFVLDHAARRWGIDRHGGTRVWFELDR
jgi:anti-sigma regulatory factor (Ser/Thr protein kinase)